ncbi:MAG: PD-(D/E)XK nuclease family protein, partial [Nanoarchaeota archaeon]
ALNLAKTNKDRHQAVQDFFITNDSTTIATETPIYLTYDDLLYFNSRGFSLNPKDFRTPVTGHIDIIQIRNDLIHILDYKPQAPKENPIHQLTIYALALASKTKLPLTMFKAAWFDENNYFEFYPLHVVKNEN